MCVCVQGESHEAASVGLPGVNGQVQQSCVPHALHCSALPSWLCAARLTQTNSRWPSTQKTEGAAQLCNTSATQVQNPGIKHQGWWWCPCTNGEGCSASCCLVANSGSIGDRISQVWYGMVSCAWHICMLWQYGHRCACIHVLLNGAMHVASAAGARTRRLCALCHVASGW